KASCISFATASKASTTHYSIGSERSGHKSLHREAGGAFALPRRARLRERSRTRSTTNEPALLGTSQAVKKLVTPGARGAAYGPRHHHLGHNSNSPCCVFQSRQPRSLF